MSKKSEEKLDKWSKRCVQWCGSINLKQYTIDDVPELKKRLCKCFDDSQRIESYFFIFHTETDTLHFHYVVQCYGAIRGKTLVNELHSYGFTESEFGINFDCLSSLGAMLKYFLHLDGYDEEGEKKRYELEDIVSNYPIEVVENYIVLDDDTLNVDRLIQICLECGNIIAVMKRLGLNVYHKYRDEIKTIFNYEGHLRFARDMERKRKMNDSLPF